MRWLTLLLVFFSSLNPAMATESNGPVHNGELICFMRKRAILCLEPGHCGLYGGDSQAQIPFSVKNENGLKIYAAEFADKTTNFDGSTVESSARFSMILSDSGEVIESPKLVVQYKNLMTDESDLKETVYEGTLDKPQIRLDASTAYNKSYFNPNTPTVSDWYGIVQSCLANFYVGNLQ